MIFKQGTLFVHQFLMVLTSDHITGATGKSPVVKIGKAGATGVTAANSPATEVDSTNLPGVYSIQFTAGDLNTTGSLALAATASSCDPTNEFHRVDTQIVPDFLLDANGNVSIASSYKKNTAIAFFPFVMTVNGVATPGLTVTAQRDLGAGFSPCANSVNERSNGIYYIALAASDTNSNAGIFRFTANTADDRDILLFFQP